MVKQVKTEAKLLACCLLFPGRVFASPPLQKSFQQETEDAKDC